MQGEYGTCIIRMMRKRIALQMKNPGKQFRGAPFWALNGRLSESELLRQIHIFREMGFGGVFLHSRTGLETEYLGEEWFSLINACIDEAEKIGLDSYLYDEDRFPSGSAGGLVTADPRFRQKYIAADFLNPVDFWIGDSGTEYIASFAICLEGDRNLMDYYPILHAADAREGYIIARFRVLEQANSDFYNGFTYLDTLNPEATACFFDKTLKSYEQACGTRLGCAVRGIFTDEPQRGSLLCGFSLSNPERERMIPWSESLFERFKDRWGYDLRERLPELFFKLQGREFSKTMWQYVEVLTQTFLESFLIPYHKRCKELNIRLTGHVFHEDSLIAQTAAIGSVMRCYEHMDEPGVDVLWEHNNVYWTVRQVASVARQMGKKRVLSELYGVTGWPFTFQGHKEVGDWQALLGVNFRCHHLAWYTMQGEAKRDYPASLSHQSAWYPEYSYVEDYFARLNLLSEESVPLIATAVIHPVESAWGFSHLGTYRNVFEVADPEYDKLNRDFIRFHEILTSLHTEFDYLDEGILAARGRVVGKELLVGKMRYRIVLAAGMAHIRNSTLALLKEFRAKGGTVLFFGELPRFAEGEPIDRFPFSSAASFETEAIAQAIQTLNTCPFGLTGRNHAQILSSFRQVKGRKDYLAMLVNTDRKNGKTDIQLSLQGNWKVTEINLRQGTFQEAESVTTGIYTAVACTFAKGQERIFYFSKGTPRHSLPNQKRLQEWIAFRPGSYRYQLSEPNVLVLDFASCTVKGEEISRREVLKLDRALRRLLGLPFRGGDMIQPWYRKKFLRKGPPVATPVLFRYDFDLEEQDLSLKLAVERPELFQLSINGVSVGWRDTGEIYVDAAFRVMEFDCAPLQTGKNFLELSCAFHEGVDIEAIYLLGDFGVRIEGNRRILKRRPEMLRPGSIVEQGFPFYGGRICYEIPVDPGVYDICFDDLGHAALYRVQDQIVAFAPYLAERIRVETELKVEAVFTRRNTFGPLHRTECGEDGCAPESFLTEGEEFTEDYVLKPQGLAKFEAIKWREE